MVDARFSTGAPRASLWKLYGAVFFTFAPMMILSVTVPAHRHPPAALAFWTVVSGGVAVVWAAAFMHNPKRAWLVFPLQVAVVLLFATRLLPGMSVAGAGVSFVGLGSVALIVAGYVFFILFIMQEGARTLRLQTEMRLAGKIHQSLVPPIDYLDHRIRISGISDACSEMGGDLIDWQAHPGGCDVYLADVSGHGVRAGVVMAMIKSAVHMRLRSPCGLAELANDVNQVLCKLCEPGMFATFAAIRFEETERTQYVLAGHHPILQIHASTGAVTELADAGLPLGVVAAETYRAVTIVRRPGDRFFIFTDGLTEVFDRRGEQLGLEGFQKIIQTNAFGADPATINAIVELARRHADGGPQTDDQSILAVTVGEC
ncbi:MAG: serine/threonine-protein phosphatase [Phycisphaerales bacterium]|nr:serine/threonine-protein phosphatase [Phycisphaerales bacterium]